MNSVKDGPIIEELAGWTLDQAQDPAARDPRASRPVAARCGVIRTAAVQSRVTLLLNVPQRPLPKTAVLSGHCQSGRIYTGFAGGKAY